MISRFAKATLMVSALSAVLGVPLAARVGVQGQARDNAAAPSVIMGTAVVAGTVVADDQTNRPLRRVSVTLASGNLQVPQTTVTDDAGVFAFASLAAGNYTLIASRPGFVSAYYGAKRPGAGPGVPIAVLDGQRIGDVRMRLLRGAVVTGLLRQENGRPAVGVPVQVLPIRLVNGQRRSSFEVDNIAGIQGVNTDDRGRYRAFGLPPGDYVVQALLRGSPFNGASGRLVTPEEIQWAVQTSAPTASVVPGQVAPAVAPPPIGQAVDYAQVYYPGTTVAAEAVAVTVGPGEERDGVDFAMRLVPTARVLGGVVDPEGRPVPGVQVSVRAADADMSDIVLVLMGAGGSRTGADGTFMLSGVRPGRYTITARGTGAPALVTAPGLPPPPPAPPPPPGGRGGGGANIADAMAMIGGLFGGGGNGRTLWANQEIVVDGRDIPDVLLQLRPGMTLSGKFVFEGTSQQPPADLTRARLTVVTAPIGGSALQMATSMLGSTAATTAADGAFAAAGMSPGSYRLNVLVPGMRLNPAARGAGWMLKSIALNGRDIADLPLDIKPNENVSGLVVTMTDQPTELSGMVLDRAGRAAPGFPIIVFSTERTYWRVGSRRVQQVRPSSDGKFFLAGLPAGEYFVCAVTDLDPSDLYDPVFLDQLAPSAFKITLSEGEKKTQDLRLAGGG